MKAELTDISNVKKRFDIEIPEDVVATQVTTIAREFARRARVKGFRPGKAPLGVVKSRYRDEILSELYQQLLPRYFYDAVKERDLELVEQPTFEEVDYSDGKPLRFAAAFEVYPLLNVTNHESIPVEAVSTEVSDEEIDQALEQMREEQSEMSPVLEDRPAREGDFVEISFKGELEGSPDENLSAEKALCEIGGKTTVKEFSENLTGTRPGEERDFEVAYRDDHPDERLAGKKARYKVSVESIKRKTRPELDDEFAQGVGDYETLDALREQLRERIAHHKQHNADEQIRDAILRWLEENNEFEVPEALITQQLQVRLQRMIRELAQQGIDPRRLDVDWSKIRADQEAQAVRDVRGSLILEHLADRIGVEASEEEIDREIETLAAEMQRPPEGVREALVKNEGMDRMKGQIRNNKVLAWLQERADLRPPGSLQEPAAEDAGEGDESGSPAGGPDSDE